MFSNSIYTGIGPDTGTGTQASAIWEMVNNLIQDNLLTSSSTVNLFRFIPPAEWTEILNRTSTYDCSDAIESALSSQSSGSGTSLTGAFVSVPNGLYNFSRTIQPKFLFGLIGLGSGLSGSKTAEFKFAAGISGLVINRHNTLNGGVEETPTGAADASVLSGIAFVGAGYSSTGDAHGLYLRARAHITNCSFNKFRGDGIRVVASAETAETVKQGNANLFRLIGCDTSDNYGNGLYVDGADANSGYVEAHNTTGNGLWGIRDSSFLGNYYMACHSATNGLRGQVHHTLGRYYLIDDTLGGSTTPGTNKAVWVFADSGGVHATYPEWVGGTDYAVGGAYCSDGVNAVNTFMSCYSEGGQPPSKIIRPSMVWGGLHGGGFQATSTHFYIGGDGSISSFSMKSHTTSIGSFDAQFCKRADEFMTAVVSGDHAQGLSLLTWDQASGDWITRHARLDARTPVRYTTNLSTATAGRSASIGGGQIMFPQGVFVGSSVAYSRKIDNGTAPPTTGESARGDVRFNLNASVGAPSGWQCVTSGTNGSTAVWAAMPGLVAI